MSDQLTCTKLNEQFPDLNFEKFITKGGQKSVYYGSCSGRECVLKLLPICNGSVKLRAMRELDLMQKVDTKNFVNLIQIKECLIDSKPYLIIIEEYISGLTLEQYIANNKPDHDLAIRVLKTILEIIVELNSKKIVHRDIKPANIILEDKSNRIVLLDLGIARLLDQESITQTGFGMGPKTICYSSPEQLANNKKMIDCRSDLFSTGIVFFETFTGIHPFGDKADISLIMEAILQGERNNLIDIYPNHPKISHLNYIFEKLTNVEPYERFRRPEMVIKKINEWGL